MRSFGFFVIFIFLVPVLAAEPHESHPVTDIYILRSAEQLQSPHIVTYRLFEWAQLRGRWILPDIGYYDTGYGKDQIWFTGGGAYIVRKPRAEWYQELYVTQEAGPQSTNKRSMWIWPVVDLRPLPRLSLETVAYPTLPLNRAQRWGMDVDRTKAEWSATSHWIVGAGYSGGICSERTWQNKPFATLTRKTRLGDFEFWLQKIPGGGQVQVRYTLARDEN